MPLILPPVSFSDWLKIQNKTDELRLLLSLQADTQPLLKTVGASQFMTFLSGPEGGLSSTEEALAIAKGFLPVTLGPRVLRSETAPLAVLAVLNCLPA